MPQRTCQPTSGSPRLGKRFSTQPTTAPRTRPPGQPACRMFSQWVLLLGKSVAVSGLMTASQVPLPKENAQAPAHRHQNAPDLPPTSIEVKPRLIIVDGWLKAYGAA